MDKVTVEIHEIGGPPGPVVKATVTYADYDSNTLDVMVYWPIANPLALVGIIVNTDWEENV